MKFAEYLKSITEEFDNSEIEQEFDDSEIEQELIEADVYISKFEPISSSDFENINSLNENKLLVIINNDDSLKTDKLSLIEKVYHDIDSKAPSNNDSDFTKYIIINESKFSEKIFTDMNIKPKKILISSDLDIKLEKSIKSKKENYSAKIIDIILKLDNSKLEKEQIDLQKDLKNYLPKELDVTDSSIIDEIKNITSKINEENETANIEILDTPIEQKKSKRIIRRKRICLDD